MIKRIVSTIKKGFRKIADAIIWAWDVTTTPFIVLTWPKRIFKLVMILLGIAIVIGVIVFVVTAIATMWLIMSVIFSFGGAIENGTNEVLGRNRHRNRYY